MIMGMEGTVPPLQGGGTEQSDNVNIDHLDNLPESENPRKYAITDSVEVNISGCGTPYRVVAALTLIKGAVSLDVNSLACIHVIRLH